MRNRTLIILFFLVIAAGSLFGMPEVHELPEVLVGEFIFINFGVDFDLTIFPNSEFILLYQYPYHIQQRAHGNIVRQDDKWYFSLSRDSRHDGYLNRGLTEIHIEDDGRFSINTINLGLLRSMRKKDIPMPANLAYYISVHELDFRNRSGRVRAKREYFVFDNSEADMIDINEIDPTVDPSIPSHYLQINNGFVEILRIMSMGADGTQFDGFLEKIEESADTWKGIIRFTNGVSYYYVENRTAEIEINSDGSIIITMFYSPEPDPRYGVKMEIYDNYEFPAKLVLEF